MALGDQYDKNAIILGFAIAIAISSLALWLVW
jgi:hypothetical protein